MSGILLMVSKGIGDVVSVLTNGVCGEINFCFLDIYKVGWVNKLS